MSYLITKLSQQSQSFLTQLISSGKSRDRVATIALARMISSYFTLPSSPVESVEQEYLQSCQTMASSMISNINELVPIDVKAVTDMCRSFYMHRYISAFPEKAVFAFGEGNSVEDFFNLSKSFSKDTLAVIANEGKQLSYFANGLRNIIRDIRECEEEKVKKQELETVRGS